jgi:16S rRNA C1402 N4-methylase RsmH
MLRHTPILVNEILAMIPDHATHFFDGTLGHGGHAEKIIESQKSKVKSIQYV